MQTKGIYHSIARNFKQGQGVQNDVQPTFSSEIGCPVLVVTNLYEYTWVKFDTTEAADMAVLGDRSSDTGKFLTNDTRHGSSVNPRYMICQS